MKWKQKTIKTKRDLELETGKKMTQGEYLDFSTAVTTILRVYGTSWDTLPITKQGPKRQGLTRELS